MASLFKTINKSITKFPTLSSLQCRYFAQQKQQSSSSKAKKTGTVKYFSVPKGFGFITSSDNEDVFVHQSQIYSNGYRSLADGEEVEFDVIFDDRGRPQATNVTGPNGEFVKGSSKAENSTYNNFGQRPNRILDGGALGGNPRTFGQPPNNNRGGFGGGNRGGPNFNNNNRGGFGVGGPPNYNNNNPYPPQPYGNPNMNNPNMNNPNMNNNPFNSNPNPSFQGSPFPPPPQMNPMQYYAPPPQQQQQQQQQPPSLSMQFQPSTMSTYQPFGQQPPQQQSQNPFGSQSQQQPQQSLPFQSKPQQTSQQSQQSQPTQQSQQQSFQFQPQFDDDFEDTNFDTIDWSRR